MSENTPPAATAPSSPRPESTLPQDATSPVPPPAGAPLGYPHPQALSHPMPPMPPGYAMPGYGMPPGYVMPPAYEAPQGYAMPPGYGMPPGYPFPPGYGMPIQAYGYPPAGYPAPPGYPLPPVQAPPSFEAIPVAATVVAATPVAVEPVPPPVSKAEAQPVAQAFTAAPAVAKSPAPAPRTVTPARETPAETEPPPALSGPAIIPPSSPVTTKRPGRFAQFWQGVGGGSLTFSLLIHVGILVLAGLIVVTTSVMSDKAVDFLPGGGTQQGQQASNDLEHQIRQKKRSKLNKSTPKSRLVSTSINAAITLPDLPPDMLDMPDASASLAGGAKLGSGGFGTGGIGGGFGSGMGSGAVKGMVAMTLFGKLGGDGMPGVFYDMKQTPDRVPTALADLASDADFANVINTAAGKKFSGKGLDQFFHSTQKMSFTYLLIPYMAATEGPKAFKVENEVQPRAWMVHYTADVRPPTPGDYRFVGMFDDALIVYVNGKPVLDGSWYSIVDYGGKQKTEGIRQDFGGPALPGTGRKCYAGKWVKMEGLTHIDIVVGERPGGRVGGLLLVQAKKGKYEERADGSPILPVFSTTKPTLEDQARMRDYTAGGFEVAEDPLVFSLTKDVFGGR